MLTPLITLSLEDYQSLIEKSSILSNTLDLLIKELELKEIQTDTVIDLLKRFKSEISK